MTKTVIREIIIALLICLAILLILAVALYNFIPANKVIPETIEYTPSKDVQLQLNSVVEDNSNDIIMTYEITAQDLENYKNTNDYKPGKTNPFAEFTEKSDDIISGEVGTSSGNENSKGGSSNNNSGGSLFEKGSSK